MIDTFKYFATKIFNKTPEEIDGLFFEKEGDQVKLKSDAGELFLQMDAERVKKLKEGSAPDTKKFFDEGYKKAQAEVMTKFENDFKTTFGVQSDLTGLELIKHHVSEVTKSGGIKDVKLHPEFLALETRKAKELEELKSTYENQMNDLQKQWQKEKTFEGVLSNAENIFLKLNPIIPESPVIASNIKKVFVDTLKQYEYQPDDAGSFIIINKDGKRAEDKHGNLVKFDEFIKEIAGGYYQFKMQDPKGNSGGGGGNGGGGTDVPIAKSPEEYSMLIGKYINNPDMLIKIKAAYHAGK